jgi:hypothetical protein
MYGWMGMGTGLGRRFHLHNSWLPTCLPIDHLLPGTWHDLIDEKEREQERVIFSPHDSGARRTGKV